MFARVRQRRPAVNAALAALVVLSLSHCSWQESREMEQRSTTLAQHLLGLPTPLQAPVHDCDHEFGCICRGATIVHALAVTDWQPRFMDLVPLERGDLPSTLIEINLIESEPIDQQNLPPPFSGRQLRALYASLVI